MTYKISTGASRQSLDWKTQSIEWPVLAGRLGKCLRTGETMAEYKAMGKAAQGKVKDIGGFVGGALDGSGRRSAATVTSRSLVTLDIDYGRADTVGVVADALAGTAWCLYSTHSHTKEAPRYRLVVPLSREVTPDEYIPIARRVADEVGIDIFDDSTFQPSRLMYWPSSCKDGDYVFKQSEGDVLDADKVLATYADWRNVAEWPASQRVRLRLTPAGAKQADPTAKPGIIGAFCRAYTVSEAIDTFLPGVYERTAQEGRWTYVPGSTAGGMVVYEDKWAYSHHGTDPCGEREVNAFDLVRIHRFGAHDEDAAPDTPVNRLPSFAMMEELARSDAKVHALLARESISDVDEVFADVDYEAEAGDDWTAELSLDRQGKPKAVPENFALVLRNDAGLRGKVKYDEFHDRLVLTGDLPWRRRRGSDDEWSEKLDDGALQEYVSRKYHIVGKQMLMDQTETVFGSNSFHPVRDYLRGLPKWDGVPRVETLLSTYLGAVDCPLTRAMTRKHLVAAVRRVMHPGAKYDYILTLVGPEGIGKSTLFRKLGGDWFSDSFSPSSIGDKEAMDQVRGIWIAEMAELKDYKKSTNEAFKAFLTKEEDRFRPAYGRRTITAKRQLVFCATTNETAFLKGDTGNRRFWPVLVGADMPEKSVFDIDDATRDQIWAEAVELERKGEQLILTPELERQAKARQQGFNEITTDSRAGIISAALRRPLPPQWKSFTREQRVDFFKNGVPVEAAGAYFREYISAVEVQTEILQDKPDRYKAREITQILDMLPELEKVGVARVPGDSAYGTQRLYKVKNPGPSDVTDNVTDSVTNEFYL